MHFHSLADGAENADRNGHIFKYYQGLTYSNSLSTSEGILKATGM